ncbi:wall-associated receptor kinase 4-like [Magnolia sinica]|uniref:wall-associated receptor kinase 4-like n=1 Tax=Magnolia sinica TaxID=86752 RepID=UPI002657F452|nr:wall-associated receptor kinase 4-like [Magnolia sinica]
MAAFFYFSIFIPLSYFPLTEGRAIDYTAIAGCPNKCGEVEISYPFGIGEPRCFFKGFEVVCIQNIPYLPESNLQLLKILQGEVSINSTSFIAQTCPSPAPFGTEASRFLLPETSPYTISISNQFIAIGCSTTGGITENEVSWMFCSSDCPTKESVVNGSCEGHGCCTEPLPKMRKNLIIFIEGYQSSISNCSYGFVVEDGRYMFKETDLLDFDKTANISMNLEWSIGGSCLYQTGEPAHICGSNATCSDTAEGYRCKCLDGYGGNPYLNGSQGCQGEL